MDREEVKEVKEGGGMKGREGKGREEMKEDICIDENMEVNNNK